MGGDPSCRGRRLLGDTDSFQSVSQEALDLLSRQALCVELPTPPSFAAPRRVALARMEHAVRQRGPLARCWGGSWAGERRGRTAALARPRRGADDGGDERGAKSHFFARGLYARILPATVTAMVTTTLALSSFPLLCFIRSEIRRSSSARDRHLPARASSLCALFHVRSGAFRARAGCSLSAGSRAISSSDRPVFASAPGGGQSSAIPPPSG